jgi:hypothetical protein
MDPNTQRPDYLVVDGDAPESIALLNDEPIWPRRFRSARARGVAVAVGSLIAVTGVLLLSPAAHGLQSQLSATIEEVEWRSAPPCGLMERGIEYGGPQQAVQQIGLYGGIDYDTQCRHKCFLVAECQIWTWTGDKNCKLMAISQFASPQKLPKPGATSGGMPCGMDQMLPPGTLYCFALVQPDGYELGLLADQYNKHISIFNCDESAVLSNQRVQISPGYFTEVVETDLGCAFGGEFGTALNLDIFIKVWDRIVELGTFRNHAWTVKGDADAVFFADRLRGLLSHHQEEARGVYLNNCHRGMHGPVEVFSRNAVEALKDNWQACRDHFTQLCGGDCQWGEDMFIDQCLQKVVKARRDNQWSLLVEDHCLADGQQWGGIGMCDGTHVAFHPFKDQGSYSDCFGAAWSLGEQAVSQQNQDVPPPR